MERDGSQTMRGWENKGTRKDFIAAEEVCIVQQAHCERDVIMEEADYLGQHITPPYFDGSRSMICPVNCDALYQKIHHHYSALVPKDCITCCGLDTNLLWRWSVIIPSLIRLDF